jgi:hypothetical protein
MRGGLPSLFALNDLTNGAEIGAVSATEELQPDPGCKGLKRGERRGTTASRGACRPYLH